MSSPLTEPIALLAGPQLMGMFLNWALQGVLTVQVYIYHSWFPRDRPALKALVYGMLIYEWVQTGLITEVAFQNFVYGYGQRLVLIAFHNTWFSVTIMCSLISWVVQCYFAWRIWILGRFKSLAYVIAFLSLFQMAVGVSGGVMLHVINPDAAEASHVTPVISAWLAGAAFVDIIIAVSMTFVLLRAKSGIKRSDAMINRLVRLVVETGTLTATVALVDVVCFAAFSNTLLHECPALVLAKLYSNTFLASLNNRAFMKDNTVIGTTTVGDSLPLRSLRVAGSGPDLKDSTTQLGGPQMHVTVREDTLVSRDVFTDSGKRELEDRDSDGGRGGVAGNV